MATISDLAKANVIDVIKGLFRPEIEAMNFGSIRINFENIVKSSIFCLWYDNLPLITLYK